MRDFCDMFPRIPYLEIEQVLRKYDGDVSATLNELLFEKSPTSSETQANPEDRKRALKQHLKFLQNLLDTVTDIDLARSYEDQQLACLLELRELQKK
ncbi:unnamed protein product [Caenorhabditis angaria]|uniref:CUE domain-containing protein n=1 Tax=Caenorhabditis angaria TaxID=860376 RepID=A0A9P1ILR2_9PELO|nr:unnamed protein product [Caenorhabditis angaria]